MRPGEPHGLAQVVNEQHARLNLVGIGLSVDLESDFSFHGLPCLFPVYDVVTKRAENQVAPGWGMDGMDAEAQTGSVRNLPGWWTCPALRTRFLYATLLTRRTQRSHPTLIGAADQRVGLAELVVAAKGALIRQQTEWRNPAAFPMLLYAAGAFKLKDASEPSHRLTAGTNQLRG